MNSDPDFDNALTDLSDVGKVSGALGNAADQRDGCHFLLGGHDSGMASQLDYNNQIDETTHEGNANLGTKEVLEAYRRARQRIDRLDLTSLKASL